MPSLTAKDRAPLCLFTYEDHRRCRTPRITTHPHFCFYHAQKESQSQAGEKLADDLTYFFSGNYLSANDLSAALGRLIPAAIRGEIKPRLARTVAYMLQTLMQSTRQAQHEYIEAFSTDGWRQAIHNSVNNNHDHLYPPDPANEADADLDATPAEAEASSDADLNAAPEAESQPATAQPTKACHPERSEGPQQDPAKPATAQPAKACHPERSEGPRQDPAKPTTDETHHPTTTRPSPTDTEAALAIARALFPPNHNAPPPQPTTPQKACHPERSEGPRQDPAKPATDETHHPTVPTPLPKPATSPAPTRQTGPNCDPYEVHFDHNYRLYVDGKPFAPET